MRTLTLNVAAANLMTPSLSDAATPLTLTSPIIEVAAHRHAMEPPPSRLAVGNDVSHRESAEDWEEPLHRHRVSRTPPCEAPRLWSLLSCQVNVAIVTLTAGDTGVHCCCLLSAIAGDEADVGAIVPLSSSMGLGLGSFSK